AMMFLHRREADPAIAEQHGGYAVPTRRRQQRIPHRLAVVMGMRVDPARRHEKPVGIDLALGQTLLAANACYPSIAYGDIAGECGLAGAVDNGAAANDDVVHGRRSSGL